MNHRSPVAGQVIKVPQHLRHVENVLQATGVNDQIKQACFRQQAVRERMVQVANDFSPFVVAVIQSDNLAKTQHLKKGGVLNKIQPA